MLKGPNQLDERVPIEVGTIQVNFIISKKVAWNFSVSKAVARCERFLPKRKGPLIFNQQSLLTFLQHVKRSAREKIACLNNLFKKYEKSQRLCYLLFPYLLPERQEDFAIEIIYQTRMHHFYP